MQMIREVHANQHVGWGQAGVSEPLRAHLPSPFIGLRTCSLSGWWEGGPDRSTHLSGASSASVAACNGCLTVGQLREDILHVQASASSDTSSASCHPFLSWHHLFCGPQLLLRNELLLWQEILRHKILCWH
ncbi:hypothetical protein MC885_003438 [Smutsia gigantea]|nr:hypothetical protein MC885_003438 [Smutsia gigantea]